MDIKDSDIYVIAPHHRLQWEEAQNCFVILFPEGMVKLNSSAGEVLNLLDGVNSVLQIISILKNKFTGVEGIGKDVYAMLELAVEKSWLTRVNNE